MAKNRKTRKEKVRATKRLASSSTTTGETTPTASENRATFSFTSTSPHLQRAEKSSEIALTSHLREDLLRTAIVTSAILLAELILFYTLSLR